MKPASRRSLVSFLLIGVGTCGAMLAQPGTAVPNWTVPPYRPSPASGGISTMSDISTASIFVAVTPCRVFDTRNPAGPYGGPRLAANVPRIFDVDGGPCTGIPAGAAAYSMNFGAIFPDDDGFLTVWPEGALPTVSSMNFVFGEVIANAAIVPASSSGGVTVFASQGVHLYGDINGYFMDYGGILNPGTGLWWTGVQSSQVLFVDNLDTTTAGVNTSAIKGRMATNQHGPAAVSGHMQSLTGFNFGVKGETDSDDFDSAGVKGVSGNGDPLGISEDCDACFTSGVRGVNGPGFAYGVLGLSRDGAGVAGVILDDSGTGNSMAGYLGADFGIDPGSGGGSIGPDWGVFAEGDIGATGVKHFVDPHPTDPSKIIRYIALEGPEAGTYFRGRGKFQNGLATIEVPEDFRLVTDAEGLSIQVTPIGEMASFAVAHIGLDRIVVKGSRDVEFFYTVNGVRSTFKSFSPITEGFEFVPKKGASDLPRHLSAEQKRRLIANGTYRPDGTVNLETARRLGWDRLWEARRSARPLPEPPSSAP
jgi:hypothetical protein